MSGKRISHRQKGNGRLPKRRHRTGHSAKRSETASWNENPKR